MCLREFHPQPILHSIIHNLKISNAYILTQNRQGDARNIVRNIPFAVQFDYEKPFCGLKACLVGGLAVLVCIVSSYVHLVWCAV